MSMPGMQVHDARPTAASPDAVATVRSLMLAERTRWAMRIHDGLTQSVTSAVLELETLRRRIEADPVAAVAALAEVEAELRRDLHQIRTILFELDDGDGPVAAVRTPTIARFIDEVVQRWKLPARVSIEGEVDLLPARVQAVAHDVVAETLANAAKHAGDGDVFLRIRATDDELRIEVEDHGHGSPAVEADEERHFGVRLMRARVAEIGGTLEIRSNPGNGTRVIACLPVGEEER